MDMINKIIFIVFLILGSVILSSNVHADFDEKYWEIYSEIQMPSEEQLPQFGGISIKPWLFQDSSAATLFSDIRILSDNKLEMPYHIVTRNPETKIEEIIVKMLNISLTKRSEVSFVGLIEKIPVVYNMIEILTDDKNFYRQVQILGSNDGQNWNLIRGDSVIFDYTREETLRHTKITFNDSNFRYLGIIIVNNSDKALKIKGLKVFHQMTEPGSETEISASLNKRLENAKDKESILFVDLSSIYPVRKFILNTADNNFQRKIIVFIKQDGKEWTKWYEDIIFSFNTEKIKESKLDVAFPEVSSREIKLVIKNGDSPPISITGLNVFGYEKILVFKLDGKRKYYIFRGNPMAKAPQYDISQLVAKHEIKDIRIFPTDMQKKNPKFAGYEKRLPLTERYKYLLYSVVIIVMAGLIILQYLVIKRADKT
jgi:hypothetical protein